MFRKITDALLLSLLLSVGTVSADDGEKVSASDMLKALGVSGANQGGEEIEVINWRELAKLIPKNIGDMEAGKIDGGTFSFGDPAMGAGMPDSIKEALQMTGITNSYSTAERTFSQKLENGKQKELTIRLIDAGFVKAMLAPFMMAVEYDSPDGLMKSVEIAGYPARYSERYNDDLEVTETMYMVLINDRVMAQFEGNENVSPDEVSAQAKGFPYDKLASLAGKKAEAAEE